MCIMEPLAPGKERQLSCTAGAWAVTVERTLLSCFGPAFLEGIPQVRDWGRDWKSDSVLD